MTFPPLLQHREEAASTNDVVAQWAREGCAHGTALYVDRQTAGRGRRGRSWQSPPGENLALSVAVVGPKYAPSMLYLPMAAGVATAQVLRNHGAAVQLKWPNDLIVDRLKLGGILCDAVLEGSHFVAAVIGIGVNVNCTVDALAPELRETSTSVRTLLGGPLDLAALAAEVRIAVVDIAERLAMGESAGVMAEWRTMDATLGRRVIGDDFEGVAEGIADSGALRVRTGSGLVREVRSGEVRFA